MNCVAVLSVVVCALAFAPRARANNIDVEVLSDVLAVDQVCTLREAIINANNDAATWPDCAAGSGADTININPAGTITFAVANAPANGGDTEQFAARGDLDIVSSMTINGNPSGTTINAAQLDRIFDINPDGDSDGITPPITVVLNNLTITNGRQNDTGALMVQANAAVTMNGCTVSNSTSWANDAGGVGVFSGGALTMNNCTVSGNHALLLAGGIKNEGALTLSGCTVSDNRTDSTPTRGQGIGSYSSTTVIRNTVVVGNSSGRPEMEGLYTSEGYNVIGDITDDTQNPPAQIAVITPAPGTADQIGVSAAAVNLGPLQNNGGPTPTHALLPGSIAVDAGHSFGLTTDQRGLTRPRGLAAVANAVGGDGSDSGAFEAQGACVSNAPEPPDAVDDAANVLEDSGANSIDVLANDTDANGDTLTVTSVTQGSHGSVAITGGGTGVSYTPAANYFGSDSFSYTVDDGNGGTDSANVSVNVSNVNDAPTAAGDAYDTDSNTPLHVNAPGVLGNDSDVDGDSLGAQQVTGPSHALSFALHADGSFDYTPAVDFAGNDSFTYRASDGSAQSNTVTVNITVHDKVPPALDASVGVGSLWSPNHDLVNVGLNVSASDNSGDPVAVQVAVFSDEDDVTSAGGEMSPDAKTIAPNTLRLRAERSGNSDGRIYLIVVTATDSSNNVARACLAVVVPKSQSGASAASVAQQAQAAVNYCETHGGAPPPGYFVVGDGPTVGPKQ
ncbi:MAG TPA: Ig-like domain-containing protein [Pyrinomonadaceae bacterium]|nr:Ig-like domain-containing protein [Pyrinomonadaceae bacterium]